MFYTQYVYLMYNIINLYIHLILSSVLDLQIILFEIYV